MWIERKRWQDRVKATSKWATDCKSKIWFCSGQIFFVSSNLVLVDFWLVLMSRESMIPRPVSFQDVERSDKDALYVWAKSAPVCGPIWARTQRIYFPTRIQLNLCLSSCYLEPWWEMGMLNFSERSRGFLAKLHHILVHYSLVAVKMTQEDKTQSMWFPFPMRINMRSEINCSVVIRYWSTSM